MGGARGSGAVVLCSTHQWEVSMTQGGRGTVGGRIAVKCMELAVPVQCCECVVRGIAMQAPVVYS